MILQTVLKRAEALGEGVWCMFVDLAKAYDSIDRARLWEVFLEDLHLTPDLVQSL